MTNTTDTTSPQMPLGISGYTFADLHEPERSRVAVRAVLRGGARRPGLLGRVGRVSAAARRAASAGGAVESADRDGAARQPFRRAAVRRRARRRRPLRAATRAQDDLFRFKVDFVRRRALPLLKGGAHVDVDRRKTMRSSRRLIAARRPRDRRTGDRARRLRAARREKTDKRSRVASRRSRR